MNVLIACEESQRVCMEFRKRGHNAFSCDILPCSGEHPEFHINADVLPILKTPCAFDTQDGKIHFIEKWDLIIAHPPCTFLAVTGNRWFNVEKYGEKALERINARYDAIKFFMEFALADCEHIAIENPVGTISTYYRKPDQIIQPFMFGDKASKRTCLWLKNLPALKPTEIVEPEMITFKSGKRMCKWYYETSNLSPKIRAKERSKTFPGIARAMAEQWG